jgi:hypothetical protein
MYKLQTSELFDDEEQEKADRESGVQKILPMV